MIKRKRQPETILTNALIRRLAFYGYKVKKVYNGGVPARCFNNRIVYKTKDEESKGIPDLIAYNARRKHFMFIEVKAKKKKGSPEQEEFISSFNKCKKYEAFICWNESLLEEHLKIIEKKYEKSRIKSRLNK